MHSNAERPMADLLVVDDTPANLKLLTGLLREHGYRVRGALNGALALGAVAQQPPDLILLDIKMPGMDGFEVCAELRHRFEGHHIPIIFISALTDPKDKVHAFEAGGVDYITKPFEPTEVLARVRTHLDLSHTRRSLEEAGEQLKALDRLKSMFIASMSHELRTPLNSIISFSGILLQEIVGDINERQRDSLERVQRAGKHLLALISDVIDISKIEAGRVDIFLEDVAIKAVVNEALDNIRLQAEDKGLTLTVEADAWPVVQADQRRLLQCLVNLLGNALKFTEAGEITLSVSEVDDEIEIAVRDTGIGIAEQDLPKLFAAFERLESHLRVRAGGTGLGLYLTRKIATEILQGRVTVESRLNEGSTFTLIIPKKPVPADGGQ